MARAGQDGPPSKPVARGGPLRVRRGFLQTAVDAAKDEIMAAEPPQMAPGDAVLVVDVQRDFCPGGALAVPEGDQVVGVLNEWMGAATHAGALIVASRDWHPANHVSFVQRGGPWPPHCVQESVGAQLHPELKLPPDGYLLSKGQEPDRDAYSAFDGTGLEVWLRERDVRRLFVGGLAQDICVRATVLDGLRLGFETHVLCHATRPVDSEAGEQALRDMRAAGAILQEAPPARSG